MEYVYFNLLYSRTQYVHISNLCSISITVSISYIYIDLYKGKHSKQFYTLFFKSCFGIFNIFLKEFNHITKRILILCLLL